MPLIAALLLAGFLTATIGDETATRTSPQGTPPPESCPATLTVGHVPGHVRPVWELRCATPDASD